MKLIVNGGNVRYVRNAGSAFVMGGMPEASALKLCEDGDGIMDTNFPDYTLCIEGKYVFPATDEEPAKEAGAKPVTRKGKKVCAKD